MIVVPPFAVGEQAENDIVAAIVWCVVVAIAPKVSHRIDRPCRMPMDDGTNEHAPHEQAKAEPDRFRHRPTEQQLSDCAAEEEDAPGHEDEFAPPPTRVDPRVELV